MDATPRNDNPQQLSLTFIFEDPRLMMGASSRMMVRVISSITYIFLGAAAAALLLFPDKMWAKAIGLCIVLFLLDRLVHLADGEKSLAELPREGIVNLAPYLRPPAFRAVQEAFQKSLLFGHDFYLELAEELLQRREVREGLHRLDVVPEEFRTKLDELMREGNAAPSREEQLTLATRLVAAACEKALQNGHHYIRLADLFAALATMEDALIRRLFRTFGIEADDMERALLFSIARSRSLFGSGILAGIGSFRHETHRGPRHRIMNRAWTSRPTYTLDQFGTDFTDLARQGTIGFLVGHEKEYERMVDTLARPINPNVILVGDPGAGKEAIVAHLALNIVRDKVPKALFDKRVVALHLSSLVAGASPAEVQQRLERIAEEIVIAGNVILYIPDIHNLVKTSGGEYMSAADALIPIVMNNAFPVVGATYPKEFKEYVESRSDFVGAFEVIHVEEISEAEAERLLVYHALVLEQMTGVLVSFGAVKEAVRVAKKHFRQKLLPSSAEEILKEAVSEAKKRGVSFLGPDIVVEVAERKTTVPIHEATEEESEKLLHFEEIVHQRFVNQDEAVKVVAQALREYRSGLARPGGPIASFLFVGPTGVGKTQLAKLIAEIQFGSPELMVRFDMSEYQDSQSLFRFIGTPDGKTPGALTDAVREHPYSIVLLDEFEKANHDILNIFLQVLDDGRLTDSLGRVTDFQNTIIIATSNAHSDLMKEALEKGESISSVAEYLKARLTDVFRPELLNRFTRIVVFRDLRPDEVRKVAEIHLAEFARLVSEQGITLTFSPDLVAAIAKWGYDPAFGARPIRRAIEDRVRAPLAEKILRKEIVAGSAVQATVRGEEVVFVPVAEEDATGEKS
ncbi:ATP-dependent Clp protease ATP-binding subunit [Candidatus Parcubacteria bacterium]|nr:MAG: ATP-dependent Clp protease ATP-binding subunit [Candidatus Parcubacteria bacterium]